jgi:hypothetical protein
MSLIDDLEVVLARTRMLNTIRSARREGLYLPFNGELSADELRMAAQCTFDGPASWEEN